MTADSLTSGRDSSDAPMDPRWRVLVNDDAKPDLCFRKQVSPRRGRSASSQSQNVAHCVIFSTLRPISSLHGERSEVPVVGFVSVRTVARSADHRFNTLGYAPQSVRAECIGCGDVVMKERFPAPRLFARRIALGAIQRVLLLLREYARRRALQQPTVSDALRMTLLPRERHRAAA